MKSGFLAILGRPNVGKSTIMNALIGQKIAIVSPRAQTTRKKIQTVYTDDRGQIIFLDTPGITKAETKLGEYMDDEIEETVKTADAAMWIIEPSTFIGAGERKVLSLLAKSHKPAMIVINKEDLAEENKIARTKETYSQAYQQAVLELGKAKDIEAAKDVKILACSGKAGLHMKDLMQAIFDLLPEGPLYYDPDTLTDETEREIASEYIREKCLLFLDKEIPHGIAVEIMKMKERTTANGEPIVDIEASILCERESHKGIVIGKKGAMLKKIGSNARHDIEEMLDCKVNLKLWVKARPGWRDNDMNLKSLGYNKKK